ncbi:MAG: bacillithiol system redox-active protein YtxJ [Flavobacteriales bacterium]
MNNWKHITTEQDINDIVERSKTTPQVIFKDSTHCGISAFAKERLATGLQHFEDKGDFNYLDLLTYRSVSNYIASSLKVIHQSPQIIVLKNGEVTYTTSHHSIEAKSLGAEL